MENRNEIGKMFKDKLELLDKKPSNNLWASIETDLNKKRKRRVLFWLIPSLLTAFITSSILFFGQTEDKTNATHMQEKENIVSKNNSSQDKRKTSKVESNTISKSGKSGATNRAKIQGINTKIVESQSKPTIKTITEPSTETKTTIKKTRSEKLIKQSSKLIASTEDYEEYEVLKKYKVIVKKNKIITTTQKASKTKTVKTTPKKKMIVSSKKKTSNSKKKPINTRQKTFKTSKTISTNPTDSINNTISLKKEITNKTLLEIVKTDSIKKDSLPKKPERKPTAKREYVKRDYPEQKSETDPEYSISAYYGPAIFGANESTINKSFNDFSKSHPITSHYGVYFKSMYGKIGFRVGIAKINLKTTTSVNSDPSDLRYENIKMSTYNSADIDNTIKNDGGGKFEQKISYYEMPLEFNYALKKDETPFGMEAFTGFSILILDANQLSFSSDSFKSTKIGELKNLSETNLSFNLGLGFNYKLTEKFQLDFNPIFKYYLTTYNEDNTAKPYSLSIQSGVTYKF
jgi:hypothetical protein